MESGGWAYEVESVGIVPTRLTIRMWATLTQAMSALLACIICVVVI